VGEYNQVRQGDVVIRRPMGDGPCASVVVTADGVLPDDRWILYTFPEALVQAREVTRKTGGAIWQVGPDGRVWNRIG
jgi:hypothetical protein